MSFQEPQLVKEAKPPKIAWIIGAVVALVILLVVGALYYLETERATAPVAEDQRLEGALRNGTPEFEEARSNILVGQVQATESPRAAGDIVMELTASITNNTGRTINGLELRGAVLDAQGNVAKERTVIVIPAQQEALNPNEKMDVRILLEGVSPQAERDRVEINPTGIRFN